MRSSIFDSDEPLDRAMVAISYATWTFPLLALADRFGGFIADRLDPPSDDEKPGVGR